MLIGTSYYTDALTASSSESKYWCDFM